MGIRPLVVLVSLEAGLLAALFLLLLTWSPVSALLNARRRRRELAAHAALRAWQPGDPTDGPDRALERCSPYSLRRLLETRAARRAAAAGLPLAEMVRRGQGHTKACRWARSAMWWRRLAAAQLLALVGGEDDVPILLRLLHDPHPAPASAALLAARRLRDPALLPALLDLAVGRTEGPLGHKRHVEIVLVDFGDALVDPLLARFETVRDEAGLVTLLRLAGRLGDAALRGELAKRVTSAGLEVRVNAVRALSGLPKQGSVRLLREALDDPAWQVRAQAAAALGRLDARTAGEDLLRALSDPSWWVRLRAALALRQLGWSGQRMLESVQAGDDRYARDMAQYVMELGEGAVTEYAS